MKELQELEQETVEEELLNIPVPGPMPSHDESIKVPGKLQFLLVKWVFLNHKHFFFKAKAKAAKKKVDDEVDELKKMADWAS